MGALAAEIDLIEFPEQIIDFGPVEPLIGTNHPVAGHQYQQLLDALLKQGTRAERREFGDHITNQALGFDVTEDLGDSLENEGGTAEAFQFETAALQQRRVLFDQCRIAIIELQHLRKQQPLLGNLLITVLGSEFFETDPFVGGMLVDQQQVLPVLAKDVAIAELPDHPQSGRIKTCIRRQRIGHQGFISTGIPRGVLVLRRQIRLRLFPGPWRKISAVDRNTRPI